MINLLKYKSIDDLFNKLKKKEDHDLLLWALEAHKATGFSNGVRYVLDKIQKQVNNRL